MRAAIRCFLLIALVLPGVADAQARPVLQPGGVLPPKPVSAPWFHRVEDLRIDGDRNGLRGGLFNFLLVNPRGRMVFGDAALQRVFFFDALGKRIGEFGKCGDGPGEFSGRQYRSGVMAEFDGGTVADSIWVYDAISRRITYVASDGTFLRTMVMDDLVPRIVMPQCGAPQKPTAAQMQQAFAAAAAAPSRETTGPNSSRMVPIGAYADGGVLWQQTFETSYKSPSYDNANSWSSREDSTYFVRSYAASDSTYVVARMPENPAAVFMSGVLRTAPYSDSPRMAVSQDGNRVGILTTKGGAGTIGVVSLTVIGPKRDTLFVRDYAVRGRASDKNLADGTTAQMARNINDGVQRLNDKQTEEFYRRLRAAVAPVWVKADLMFGVDNSIWIALPYAGGPYGEWLILDPKGEPVASVPRWSTMPRTTAVTQDRIWVVEYHRNGLDLVRYRLERDTPKP